MLKKRYSLRLGKLRIRFGVCFWKSSYKLRQLRHHKWNSVRKWSPSLYSLRLIQQKLNLGLSYSFRLREKQKLCLFLIRLREKRYKFLMNHLSSSLKKFSKSEYYFVYFESNLVQILVRLGWAQTLVQARQWVRSGFILINGIVVKVPSRRVFPGEVIFFNRLVYKSILNHLLRGYTKGRIYQLLPKYLRVDFLRGTAVILRSPAFEEITWYSNLNINLAQEYFRH